MTEAEDFNALNTTMEYLKRTNDSIIYVIKYFEEPYLDVRAKLEKEGKPNTSNYVIAVLIEKAKEAFPDYKYVGYSFSTDKGIELIIKFKKK